MRLNKEFTFFAYLIESYASYKWISAYEALKLLDDKDLTDFVYSMYEMYHMESLENAFLDIDSLITTGKTAW